MSHADLQTFLSNRSALPRTTTLFREPGLRTILLHLNAGERIPEHRTRGAILVHCVAGQGDFQTDSDRVELRPGVLTSVPAGEPHSVTAAGHDGLLLLVTIAEQDPPRQ